MISKEATLERIVFIELTGEISPVPAGLFSLDIDTGIGRFSYGRRYLERPTAIAIDPVNLPLSEREYLTRKNGGIFGVLGDLLPDSWGRTILAKQLGIHFSSLGNYQMFEHLTTSVVGALSLGSTPEQPAILQAAPVLPGELHRMAEVFARLILDRILPPGADQLLIHGLSMGGTQPKCPVIYDNEEWLAKFENPATPVKLPKLEFATMLMAKRAGINVPDINLGEIGGKSVYLIKRFDRQDGNRLPFLSGYAMSDHELNQAAKGSYIEIARRMRTFVKHVSRDLHELYRRLVFNVFIRNQNDHLRNHGFICQDNGWHLSPAFDLLPGLARKSTDDFALSLNIGGEGAAATLSNLYSLHEEFNLDLEQAARIVSEIDAATLDWEKTLRECYVPKTDIEEVRWSFAGFRELSQYIST